ncbi:MAG: hypothetical protein JSS98_07665 [Bacteroidetes bacterium]|nr:hypothetical protein [Bacteroidota bacterium]
MRKNYLLLSICALTALAQTTFAQENKNISAYISGGNVIASGKMKDSAFIKNGWNIEAGGFMPFYRKGWDGTVKGGSRFSLGIEAGVNYSSQNAGGGAAAYNKAFPYQGGTMASAFGNGTPRASSFQIFAGPKAEWVFGKIAVSPSVLLGYFSLNRKGYSLSGTITNPNQTTESKDITFIAANDYTASGVVLKPGIELGYQLSHQISLFAKGVQSYGPSIKNNITLWIPQSNNGENFYNYGQFLKGTEVSETITNKWQSTSVNVGLRIIINSMPSRLSMTPTTTRQTQGQNFGEKVAGGLQSGGGALSQGASRAQAQDFNTTRSNRERGQFVRTGGNGNNPTENDTLPQRQEAQDFNTTRSNRERGQFFIAEGNGNNPTGNDTLPTRQEAQDFNTTRSNRERGQFLNTAGDGKGKKDHKIISPRDASSGLPTGKRMHKPITITKEVDRKLADQNLVDDEGKADSINLQARGTAQDFNTTRSNRDNRLNTHPNSGSNSDSTSLEARKLRTPPSESYNPWEMDDANEATVVNPLYEEKGTSGSNPMFDPAAMAKPGQPIGGIIVKGGRNPGGQMLTITSGNNGEVILNNLEKGSYLFTLNLPKKPAGKGINEAGVKFNDESAQRAMPGNPIGGIIVKGGKNPGGSFIILTVNTHGQIGFEVQEAGNYKLILTAPVDSKNSPVKKIKEKASSGLKDTLKTNV